MPRTFSPSELTSITLSQFMDLSETDQAAYTAQLVSHWVGLGVAADRRYAEGDYALVGTKRSVDWGE